MLGLTNPEIGIQPVPWNLPGLQSFKPEASIFNLETVRSFHPDPVL
jgi:hypothetical protein